MKVGRVIDIKMKSNNRRKKERRRWRLVEFNKID